MNVLRFLLLGSMVVAAFASPVYGLSQQETLNRYLKAVEKNPYDVALRGEIIRHVETMNPPPPVPETFHRHFSRGMQLMNEAQGEDGFKTAARELEKAALIAPWDGGAYYQLGLAQDKAGMAYDAIKSLKLYLLATPDAPNAAEVEALITSIVNRLEKKQE